MSVKSRGTRARVTAIVAAIAIVVPAVAANATGAGAATFSIYTVNSTTDATDAAGSGLCATQPPTTAQPCTLRAAIAEANALSGVTINVPAGTYNLTLGALTISKPMTIQGVDAQPGPNATTIDGGAKDRVLRIAATGVNIDGVVIQNGKSKSTDGFQGDSGLSGDGGGILVSSGAGLTLTKSTVRANTAAAEGGALDIDGPTTIRQSTITGNTATSTGGGITSDATLVIDNSTITGNTGVNGGGIWANGTTTIRASTITSNKATSSSGGGLYRKSGTFTITGNIIAGNSATTGPDCYGSPTLSGTNLVQVTTGCGATGGTILTGDPKLGALADNGGPTQTQRPQSGSPAIDAYLPTGSPATCATETVDQRGIARPQPAGGKCDLGAEEIHPLGLDMSLTSNVASIPVGTGTVPLANIPETALVPAPPGTPPTQSSGYRNAAFNFAGYRNAAFDWAGYRNAGYRNAGYRNAGYRNAGYRNAGYRNAPFNFAGYRNATLGFEAAETIVKNAGLTDPLSTIPLTDIGFNYPGGWTAFLSGTQFAGAPLNTLTFAQVLPLLDAQQSDGSYITVDNLELSSTPLGSLPYVVFFLGGTPFRSIPRTTALETATDAARLADWCAQLKNGTQDPCTALHNDPNLTPLAVSLAGFSVDGAGLDQVLAKDIAAPDSATFGALSLANYVALGSRLATIPVGSLPAGYVTCAASTCPTLADAANQNAIVSTKTLLDLFTDPTALTLTQVNTFTLPELITGLLPPELQQWQTINVANVPLQNAASPSEPVETYTMTLNVKGDRSAATTAKLTLPAGWVVAPGTLTVDSVAQPDPTPDANNVITLSLGTLAVGTHTVVLGTRAGLTIGPATASASATATAGTDNANASASNQVTVTEAFENSGVGVCKDTDPCDTQTLQPNTLYIAHISSPTDRDLYHFTVPSTPGQKTAVSILLSNLPTTPAPGLDADLVLFGPPANPLRNVAPQHPITTLDDNGLSLYPNGDHLAPDTVQDVPLTGPSYAPGVIQVSAQRGTVNEEIDTGTLAPGDYAVQVSGYNGEWSTQPYVLRMTSYTFTPPQCAAPVARTMPDGGPLPDVTTLGNNPHVLFLVPQHRLYQTYGAARVDALIANVQTLATQVGGTILAVDNPDTTAAAKYSAWDNNRCDFNAANDVVREIGHQIDAARAANPAIDTVVIVGDDSMVPMARVPDRTRLANESGYGGALLSLSNGTFYDNELSAGLGDGNILTDDAYGTDQGVSVNAHELFVPKWAVGRLVETPEDINAQISTYLNNNGTLDPTTAQSALVTGADFMKDGAQGVASALAANNPAASVDSSLISDTWSASDLLGKMFPAAPASSPGIISFNGHFDQTHMLAGDGHTVVNSQSLALNANLSRLARRMVFSMGCHSGLSVDDISIGTQFDWPQAFTGTSQGAEYVGNTGFGYGDDTSVALGERLVGLYAQALDGKVSVGRALMLAKQKYFASTEVVNPYDEKVLQESVFYGLPLYNLAAPVKAAAFVRGTAARTVAATGPAPAVSIAGTDPKTGLDIAPIDLRLTLPGAGSGPLPFHRNDTAHGSYFDVNGETIQAQYRPIEPSTTVDVTQPDGSGGLARRAKGVLITALASADLANFAPDYFLPKLDQQNNEQLLTPVGDAVFPSELSNLTTSIGENGSQQQVTFTAGQFRDPTNNGNGTQRFYSHIGAVAFYARPTDPVVTTPTQILQSKGEIVGGTAGFTITTDGTAKRVVVLFKDQTTIGDWQSAELTPTTQPDGSIRWWGGGPVATNAVEFIVQAVSQYGDVSLSNNKVENFVAQPVPASSAALQITLTPSVPNSGWFASQPVVATVTAPAGAGVSYSLDSSPIAAFPAGGVSISGPGVHHILVVDTLGDFSSANVSIDATAPTVTTSIDPQGHTSAKDALGNTWYAGAVALTMTADDGSGSGVQSITYSATGALSIPSTTVNGPPGLTRSPLGTASTTVTVNPATDGATTFSYSASDVAGNSSASSSTTVNIDTTAPTFKCNPPDASMWFSGDVSVGCTSSDAGVGLANAADASFQLTTSLSLGTQSSTVQTSSRTVCDKVGNCVKVGPLTFKIDEQKPTISGTVVPGTSTSAVDGSGNTWWNGPVSLQLNAADGVDGSGVASIGYSSTGALVTSGSANAASTTVGVNPPVDGSTTFSYTATDGANNTSATGTTTINIDRTGPVATCSAPDSAWHGSDQSVSCTSSDAGVGLANAADASFSLSTSLAAGTQSSNALTATRSVCDLLGNCTPVGPFSFKIDKQKPTISGTVVPGTSTSAVDGSGNTWWNGPVSLQLNAADGVDGSGIASISYSSTGALVTSGSANAATTTVGVNPAGDGATVFSYTANDGAGNASAIGKTTINIDRTGPVPTCTAPDALWHAGDQSVSCTVTDAGVGLANAADASFSLATSLAAGTQSANASTASRNVCDLLGNCTMVGPFSFKIDKQKPTISGTVVPGTSTSAVDGSGNTWWNGPVSLQLNANDGAGGSGVASISYSSTGALVTSGSVNAASTTVGVNPAGDGATTFGYSATDVAGNPSANGATTIYIDRSGPVPTCTAADSAWHATDQSVNCTVADAGVGLMNASDASFSLSTSVSAGSQSANALTASRNVCDKLNNCTVVGPFAFKIDKTNPTASITTPVNNATYSTGQVVNASYACADTGSGIAAVNGCVGTVANGTPIDTSAGTHQFNVTAKDVVGNTYSTSVTYTVTTPYQVCPQYDTTTPKPRTGTVVIKLWLCDATGNNLSSSSLTLTAKYIDNVGQPPSPDFQGGSNYGYAFRFDPQSSTYIYNLDPTSPSQLGAGKHTLYFVVNGAASPLYTTSFMLK